MDRELRVRRAVSARTLPIVFALSATCAIRPPIVDAQDGEFDDDWEDDYEALDEGDERPEQDERYFEGDELSSTGGTADDERVDEERDAAAAEERDFQRRRRVHNTWDGAVGGLRVADAGTGASDTYRVQVLTEFFVASDFLVPDDDHEHVGGVVSFGWSPFDFLELYASLSYYSNSNPYERPNLFQTFGEPVIGVKGIADVGPAWLRLGGDASWTITTGTGAGIDPSAMGALFRVAGSVDLRDLERPFPLVGRLNLGYRLDNTAVLVEATEQRRYESLEDPFPIEDETAHLVTPIERFGLGMNRTDFFEIGLGFEVPLEAAADFFIHPLVEWTLGIPVNRQGYQCVFVPAFDGADSPAFGEDSCLADEGLGALPQQLTFGLRVMPPVPGLSTLLAVDIGLTGTSFERGVRELAATPPWNLVLGASYAFDVRPPPEPEIIVREIPKEVEVQQEPPPSGRIRGVVVETASGAGVHDAVVDFMARPETSQLTDGRGEFVTMRFEPGATIEMHVTADGYDPGDCAATIPDEGGDVEVRCEIAQQQLVVVEESEVQILEQINFAFDSDEILESSFGLMRAIARVLNENPQLTRIEIQGHTDDQGTAAYNMDLSERRAASVRRWLVEHGVDEGRLESRGYGLTVPLVPNDSEENRARNRRVQFIIQERAEDQEGGAEP
jgi:outer membrane protein OmpA-like peptidoglycan-associated protein